MNEIEVRRYGFCKGYFYFMINYLGIELKLSYQPVSELSWILFRNEYWKYIPGFEDRYMISCFGRIKCLEYMRWNGMGYQTIPEFIKKFHLSDDGYPVFRCNIKDGRKSTKKIHRIVCELFIPLPDKKGKLQVNHIDGIKLNNSMWNLEWVTHSENIKHAYKMGLMNIHGDKHPNKKVTRIQVEEIRKRILNGEDNRSIASDYPITHSMVSKIRCGHSWH